MKKVIIGLALVACLSLGTNRVRASDGGGTGVGGGGDAIALEFVSGAQQLVLFIDQLRPADREPIDIEKLRGAVASVVVKSKNKVKLGGIFGREVMAKNEPDKNLITVSRSQWPTVKSSGILHSLVLHEYLGIMGANDGDYQISGPFMRKYSKLIQSGLNPMVEMLRTDFEEAQEPTLEQLQPGRKWNCTSQPTLKQDGKTISGAFLFVGSGQFIRNSGTAGVRSFVADHAHKAWLGTEKDQRVFVRKRANGDLVVEFAHIAQDGFSSVVDSKYFVDSYAHCAVNETDSGSFLPCGSQGSWAERIKECNTTKVIGNSPWVLVSRSELNKEIWLDTTTWKVWSDAYDETLTDLGISLEAGDGDYRYSNICPSKSAVAGLNMLTWTPASGTMFKTAEEHGIRSVLPNMQSGRSYLIRWEYEYGIAKYHTLAYSTDTGAVEGRSFGSTQFTNATFNSYSLRCVADINYDEIKAIVASGVLFPCTGSMITPQRTPVGGRCVTKKGAIMELVIPTLPSMGMKAWKSPDGMIWGDFENAGQHYTYGDITSFIHKYSQTTGKMECDYTRRKFVQCAAGSRLPTIKDAEACARSGCDEVWMPENPEPTDRLFYSFWLDDYIPEQTEYSCASGAYGYFLGSSEPGVGLIRSNADIATVIKVRCVAQ